MNKGTAKKWIECLKECEYLFDNTQLGFVDGVTGLYYMSPLGVLCEFLDPGGFIDKDFGREWHGELFTLPEVWMKKAKIKSKWLDHHHLFDTEDDTVVQSITFYDAIDNFAGSKGNNPFESAAEYIEEHYEQF